MASKTQNGHRRVAIVKGLRTPFVKAGTVFGQLTALDLGRVVHGRLTAGGSGPAGAVLDIGWDERLWQGRPWPHPGSRFPGWNQVDSWVLADSVRPVTTLDTRTGRYQSHVDQHTRASYTGFSPTEPEVAACHYVSTARSSRRAT